MADANADSRPESGAHEVGPGDQNRSMEDLLVAIAQHRDKQAFAELFAHFAPRVKAYMMRLGASPAAAEELTQDVMLTVWRRADSYKPEQAGASTWLFTIARNRRIDLARRENKPELDPHDPVLRPGIDPAADQRIEVRQQEAVIQESIQALPREQAELLRMAFFEDKTHQQIAEERDLPLGTVKSRLRLALGRMRKTLENTDFGAVPGRNGHSEGL